MSENLGTFTVTKFEGDDNHEVVHTYNVVGFSANREYAFVHEVGKRGRPRKVKVEEVKAQLPELVVPEPEPEPMVVETSTPVEASGENSVSEPSNEPNLVSRAWENVVDGLKQVGHNLGLF